MQKQYKKTFGNWVWSPRWFLLVFTQYASSIFQWIIEISAGFHCLKHLFYLFLVVKYVFPVYATRVTVIVDCICITPEDIFINNIMIFGLLTFVGL